MENKLNESLLALVCLGIGHSNYLQLKDVDWNGVYALAVKHGLLAVVLDGVERLNGRDNMPQELKLNWIGEVLQSYEQRYALYEKAISKLASFYNHQGYKMMVVKGYACSIDWPRPEHRPCGDIDIWQFGKQKEADKVLEATNLPNNTKIKIDTTHHHHTVFEWQGFSVENHYDFINVHHHKSNVEYEKILKELGEDDSHFVDVQGERVYLPSPNLHALFLLKHTMMHFASEGISLRQLVDWGFFVKKYTKEIEWQYVIDVLDRFGMRNMFNIINAICVGDLGFDVKIFPTVQFDPMLKDRVLQDIISPVFGDEVPKNVFKRIPFKWHRWKGNAWKHKLCYTDSMWSAFWNGVWNHLIKPSSI